MRTEPIRYKTIILITAPSPLALTTNRSYFHLALLLKDCFSNIFIAIFSSYTQQNIMQIFFPKEKREPGTFTFFPLDIYL
jgi:hypothetical protein